MSSIEDRNRLEEIILGTILISPQAITAMIQEKIDESFFSGSIATIVACALEYFVQSGGKHLITPDILERLQLDKKKSIQEVAVLRAHFGAAIEAAKREQVADIGFYFLRLRKLKCQEVIYEETKTALHENDNGQIESCNDRLKQLITNVDRIKAVSKIEEGRMGDAKDKRIKEYERRKTHPEDYIGVHTGFAPLDQVTFGVFPGEFWLFVGASGGGKSVALLNVAYSAWLQKYPGCSSGANVGIFSLEMSFDHYKRRFEALNTLLPVYGIKTASLSDEHYNIWMQGLDREAEKPNMVYLVDIPNNCNTLFIKQKLAEIAMKYPLNPIDLVIVDYMGIMTPSDGAMVEHDWERQGQISLELKQLARSEHLRIISAAQASRASFKEKTHERNTSAVARSQMIPANCDAVIHLENLADKHGDDVSVSEEVASPNGFAISSLKLRDAPRVAFECAASLERMEMRSPAYEDWYLKMLKDALSGQVVTPQDAQRKTEEIREEAENAKSISAEENFDLSDFDKYFNLMTKNKSNQKPLMECAVKVQKDQQIDKTEIEDKVKSLAKSNPISGVKEKVTKQVEGSPLDIPDDIPMSPGD